MNTPIEPAPMKTYIIRFDNGEYMSRCRLGSNFINYERTADKDSATRLYNFDSQLAMKRLRGKGEKVEREEI